jgi:hypothetical protein
VYRRHADQMVLLGLMQTFSTDLMMTTTLGRAGSWAIEFSGPSPAREWLTPTDLEVVMRIVEVAAIGMLIAAVIGTGWLAAGPAVTAVLI